MVCEDNIVCENHWITANFDINWTFWWHPEPIVPIRIFWAGMMQVGLIIGKIIVIQSIEIALSKRSNARLITRFYNNILNSDQHYKLLRWKNVPFLSECFQIAMILIYVYLRTISTKEIWTKWCKTRKPISDLLGIVCTPQHSISIHLKMIIITSKKHNKLTSPFFSYILFIRL